MTADTSLHGPGAFVGRFQPLHRDHVAMMLRVLELHPHVFVGITNPDPSTRRPTGAAPHRSADDANPFTYWQRSQMVTAALGAEGVASDRYTVAPFPIHHPDRWLSYIPRNATQYVRTFGQWERDKAQMLKDHYEVHVWTGEPRTAEGSAIRAALVDGRPIEEYLHPATRELVAEFAIRSAGTS